MGNPQILQPQKGLKRYNLQGKKYKTLYKLEIIIGGPLKCILKHTILYCLDTTIAVDWDVKPQTLQFHLFSAKSRKYILMFLAHCLHNWTIMNNNYPSFQDLLYF